VAVCRDSREKKGRGSQETYTEGAKKVVYERNWRIFAVIVLSTGSPVPSIAPSRKQE